MPQKVIVRTSRIFTEPFIVAGLIRVLEFEGEYVTTFEFVVGLSGDSS